MNSRTLLLSLVALASLAVRSQAALPPWNDDVHGGDKWRKVEFLTENGIKDSYWARMEDLTAKELTETDVIPLYILTPAPNPNYQGLTYASRLSSYYLNRMSTNGAYRAHKTGVSLDANAVLPPKYNLDIQMWYDAHPADLTAKKNTYPVSGTGKKIVVIAPTPPLPQIAGPMDKSRGSDPANMPLQLGPGDSGTYNLRTDNFKPYMSRIYPIQLTLGSIDPELLKYARPDGKYGDNFVRVFVQAGQGNIAPSVALAKEARQAGAARAQKILDAPGTATAFSADEVTTIHGLLLALGTTAKPAEAVDRFYKQLQGLRDSPDKLAPFVARWRAAVQSEYKNFIALAGGDAQTELNRTAELTALRARAAAVLDAGNPGIEFDPRNSVVDKDSMFQEWYSFDAKLEGASLLSEGAAYPYVKVHCHIGAIGGNPDRFVKEAGAREFECVSLQAPAAGARDFASPLTADIGVATFVQPPPANISQQKMVFVVKSGKTAAGTRVVLSNGKPMTAPAGARVFHPTSKEPPPTPAEGLTASELKWLTKVQADNYAKAINKPATERPAALLAAVATYKETIAKNLYPNITAAANYIAARKVPLATADSIEKTLPAVPGADLTEVIGSSGTKTELQLSAAEFKILSTDPKYEKDLLIYIVEHGQVDGNVGSSAKPVFGAGNYDPVALRIITMTARAALPATTPAPGPGGATGPGFDPVNLTADEKKLLTPTELKNYEIQELEAAKPDARTETKDALKKMNAELRAKIAAGTPDARKPYPAEANAAGFKAVDFDKMQDWQKRKFCEEHPTPAGAVAGDRRAGDLDTRKDAKQGAANSAAGADNGAGTRNGEDASWISDACKPYRSAPPPSTAGGGNGGNLAVKEPPKPGDDKEFVEKKKENLLAKPLLLAGLKGALLGLLIGSLFGPVGLIMGPIIGAALYWGSAVDDSRKGDS
ncbi:MAG: hypothetical protein HY923_10940 [Elusimicrobia bacterium]|nr:hypothetical protein [Elusimicrobiota bacterium]